MRRARDGAGSIAFVPRLRYRFVLKQDAVDAAEKGEENHDLDNPDPRRNLHRPRDQRLSAGRVLSKPFRLLCAAGT